MTAVVIESLEGKQISKLISFATDFILSPSAVEILEFCQAMSAECWSGYIDEDLICCWGLIPPSILSNQAYLWMHSTEAVREHRFLLVRHSQKVIGKALERYSTIIGHCDINAQDSMRWLKWLGAEFSPPDGPFRAFVIRSKANG